MNDGSTIMEIEPDGQGAEEIDALFRWMAKRINLKIERRSPLKREGEGETEVGLQAV